MVDLRDSGLYYDDIILRECLKFCFMDVTE